MNIVGCILFVIAGIIAIKVSGVTKKQGLSDYSKCNTAIGKVTHTEDCCGDRWIVYFTDDSGRKQVGMDDIIAASSFSNKYKRPTLGTDEQVYYYPRTDNSIYRIKPDRCKDVGEILRPFLMRINIIDQRCINLHIN